MKEYDREILLQCDDLINEIRLLREDIKEHSLDFKKQLIDQQLGLYKYLLEGEKKTTYKCNAKTGQVAWKLWGHSQRR